METAMLFDWEMILSFPTPHYEKNAAWTFSSQRSVISDRKDVLMPTYLTDYIQWTCPLSLPANIKYA